MTPRDNHPARSFAALVLAAILAAAPGCAVYSISRTPATRATPADIDALLDLMRQRLNLMHEVARWKWNAGKPIADPARERELLDRVATRGRVFGLPEDFVRRFFAAQIEAGKRIQGADFARWRAAGQGGFTGIRDLAAVRGQIDALNERLLAVLAKAAAGPIPPDSALQRAERLLVGDGIDEGVRSIVVAPLLVFPLPAAQG